MKTIKEWLEELPEPYRTQAINNTSEQNSLKLKSSLSDAIYSAFAWSKTPEGLQYWLDFKNTLND